MPSHTPRLAVAQIRMHWEMSDNVRAMKRALEVARDDGATLCAFSELAVTGFHRRIVEWARPELSGPAVDEVRATAAALGIAATFGAPTYGAAGVRFISQLFVDADGAVVGTVDKAGLTEPEATFFAPGGTERPTLDFAGMKCSAIICREIEDAEQILPQLQGTGVELIFWPGGMRPDPAKPVAEPPVHVAWAQDIARRAGAYVVQINWPNALNRPEESENAGCSACIAPTGELLFRLPKEGCGVATFALGEGTFRWHPSPA
jgi:omega-amidase